MAKKQAEKVQAASLAPEATQESPSLNISDLVQVVQIIQVTSQRGAYRAEELGTVGALYTKLVAFLESVGAINQSQANAEEK